MIRVLIIIALLAAIIYWLLHIGALHFDPMPIENALMHGQANVN